jgi:uncharacterized membrane protein YfcA
MALKKDFGRENSRPPKAWTNAEDRRLLLCAAIGLVIGCYDGLVGPGTGTFLMLAFTAVLGFDLLKATGCAKVANLASNIASAVVWILNGSVMFGVVSRPRYAARRATCWARATR